MSVQNPARSFGVVPPEQAMKMSGIEFLTAMRDGHFPAPPISETLDFWTQSCEVGRVVFEARPSGRFYNPMGMVHGGWMATLLDTATATGQLFDEKNRLVAYGSESCLIMSPV